MHWKCLTASSHQNSNPSCPETHWASPWVNAGKIKSLSFSENRTEYPFMLQQCSNSKLKKFSSRHSMEMLQMQNVVITATLGHN